MTDTNLEIVQQGYAAFNRGDFDWVLDHLDPDIEWNEAPEVPGGQMHQGIGAVRAYLRSFPRIWEELRFEPEEVHEAGDTVVVMVHLSGRGQQSGVEVDARLAHVFEMSEGKARRASVYFDREQALAAVGSS